ncbi:hypothetical protein CPB84DRAFT_1816628 [Gymnopilus junonius]|uniref:Uncharacterized protein n=1 Tax=Gymnopilus junonius TaxID=109634 RepID=A0A9P5NFE8_GYMJU|nr:hypothetical protein CPB84DRAFT_1816628 [Gymnopilus junonius]
MWWNYDLAGSSKLFSIDEGPEEVSVWKQKEVETLLEKSGPWGGDEAWNEKESLDELDEQWDNAEQDDILKEILGNIKQSEVQELLGENNKFLWSPYHSKLEFLLDTIDSLPWLHLSGSTMKVILWLLHEIGVKNVPSFDVLRKRQCNVCDKVGVPMISWKSPKGNAFSFNDPRVILANDWNNPLDGLISEVWHGRKWQQDVDWHVLSLMYDAGNEQHFFIDEPASLHDGQMVWADAWEIALSTIDDAQSILIQACQLHNCMPDLEANNLLPQCFIDVFRDNVSGNKSKSWNMHLNIYITHRNLPWQLLNQQIHIHFLSCSPQASVPEQFEGIKKTIESMHENPVKVRDPKTGNIEHFCIFCNCEPGDNPMQSEASGHIGGNGNYPFKESNEGSHSIFQTGPPRSGKKTLQLVEQQVQAACLRVTQTVKDLQTETGIKDVYMQHWINTLINHACTLQQQNPRLSAAQVQAMLMYWVNANKSTIYNSFLTLKGFDPMIDTPIEILHTILLSIVKYIWYIAYKQWSPAHQKTYLTCLQATNTSELSALLWFPEISNLEQYLGDVEVVAANVLDIAALIDPTKIITKMNFNSIFHACSIVSNHLAPSCDIANQLAWQETVKHLLSGGWWQDKQEEWTWPGASLWHNDNKLQKHQAISWTSSAAAGAMNINDYITEAVSLCYQGLYVVARSQDQCRKGSWVFTQKSAMKPPVTGKILEILQATGASESKTYVVLGIFQLSSLRHEIFGMPTSLILPAKDILFEYNVQHDCQHAGCTASGSQNVMQEWIMTDLVEKYIEHKPIDQFIMNTHAFHNAHLLCRIVPCNLIEPIPFTED